MVFTLHRYIFRDLLKYFAVATLVLSVVLGLGVMLRPLQEFSVAPTKVPTLVAYTLPITLTMVIPIAALLSATLVYGRLAADNEVNACRSSGISLLTLAYPAAAFALLVGMATLMLAFHVMPSFTQRFEKVIRADARAIIFRNIEKRGDLGDMFKAIRIHADEADEKNRRLSGVALTWLAKGKVEQAVTAEQVYVEFEEQGERNLVRLDLHNAQWLSLDQCAFLGRETIMVELPGLWQDRVKFKKLGELKEIQADMTRFRPVAEQMESLREQVLVERFFEWLDQQLEEQGQVALRRATDRVSIFADGCEWDKGSGSDSWKARLVADGETRVLQEGRLGEEGRDKLYLARGAEITVTSYGREPQAILTLENVRWRYAGVQAGAGSGEEYALRRYDLVQLNLPREAVSGVAGLSWRDVQATENLGALAGVSQPSRELTKLFTGLREEARELVVEIKLELHSRLAFGVSCVVLVLLGAALGIWFRSSHLLAAFGVSFVPAAFCLITIFTGKHIAEKSAGGMTPGIIFLWSGIAVAVVANLVVYRRLLKN